MKPFFLVSDDLCPVAFCQSANLPKEGTPPLSAAMNKQQTTFNCPKRGRSCTSNAPAMHQHDEAACRCFGVDESVHFACSACAASEPCSNAQSSLEDMACSPQNNKDDEHHRWTGCLATREHLDIMDHLLLNCKQNDNLSCLHLHTTQSCCVSSGRL